MKTNLLDQKYPTNTFAKRHGTIGTEQLPSARIKGNPVQRENARLYETINKIGTRKPQIKMPFSYTKNLPKVKKTMANSMGFNTRRTKPTYQYSPREPRIHNIRSKIDNKRDRSRANLAKPILSKSK